LINSRLINSRLIHSRDRRLPGAGLGTVLPTGDRCDRDAYQDGEEQ
jgi:hypothetical protein